MTATTKTLQAVRIPVYKGVRCITILETKDISGSLRTNYFDVPAENFTDGSLTGVKAAFEIMALAREGDFSSFDLVHEAAFKVLREAEDTRQLEKDGSGAAISYLYTMGQILELAATNLDLDKLMAQSLGGHVAMLQIDLDETKADNAAFVNRMKAGKAKKKGGAV